MAVRHLILQLTKMLSTVLLFCLATLCQGTFLEIGESRHRYNASSVKNLQLTSGSQHLRCFDRQNQIGAYVDIGNVAVPDLRRAPYYFDNRMVSCLYNGIYFLYDNYNFNTGASVSKLLRVVWLLHFVH